jgi:hypothetical protein
MKNTIINMVLGTPPRSDAKVVKQEASEKEISKLSVTDTTATAPPDVMDPELLQHHLLTLMN